MTIVQQDNTKLHSLGMPHAIFHAFMLSILCAISYWSITYLLARAMSVSRNDDLLGGMWAVVATIFVYRNSRESSLRAAISHLRSLSCIPACVLISLSRNGRAHRHWSSHNVPHQST